MNTALTAALELLKLGFWPVAIYAKGEMVKGKDEPEKGKRPIGDAWGIKRWDHKKLVAALEKHPTRGVGICLGPDRGPKGKWLIDLEGDGSRADESLSKLLAIPSGQGAATVSWDSRRGFHCLFQLEEADALKLLDLLAKAGAKEGTGLKAGVWHLDLFPDLEWRIGGRKADGTIKQVQSVVPPSAGEDGVPRAWKTDPSASYGVAELPPSVFMVLQAHIEWAEERKAIQEVEAQAEVEARAQAAQNGVAAGHPAGSNGSFFTMKASTTSRENAIAAYAASAIRKECDAVASEPQGNRNYRLNMGAFKIGTLVGAGALMRSEVERSLLDAAIKSGLGQGESAATIKSGLDAGISHPRDLSGIGNGHVRPGVSSNGRHVVRPWFSNCRIETDDKGEKKHSPLSMPEIVVNLDRSSPGWPKRVDEVLFVETTGHRPVFLESSTQFIGWIDGIADVFWARGPGMISQERLFEHVRKFSAYRFDVIETVPHCPPMPGAYYMHPPVTPRRGGKLFDRLLDFFLPETPVDRELIRAAFLTPFWGGPPGKRPAFRIEGPEKDPPELGGRGTGKSTLPVIVANLAGGYIDLEEGEEFPAFKTRLLSNEEGRKRIVRVDNLKTLRLSWAPLEGFITSPVISGHALFRGEGQRPNTVTIFITVNGGSLSKDMAQRVIPIHLARPVCNPRWDEEIGKFIDDNRWEIIGEILGTLGSDPLAVKASSRWATWEKEVLGRCGLYPECQKLISKRAGEIDADDEDAFEIESCFKKKLADRQHSPDDERIKIPTSDAAEWYSECQGKRIPTSTVTSILKTKAVQRLEYKRTTNERFWIWTGTNAKPTDILLDLRPAYPTSSFTRRAYP